jgi:type I restriction enzyme S subunit
LKELEIPLPPLPVQQQIADVLDQASALMAKRKAQIEKLDLLIKSRFIEMFGDLVTNDKGWDVKRLDQIADSRLGKMLDSKRQTGNDRYPYLANFNVQWFRFDLEKLNEMDFDKADRNEFALEYGDLLVCEGGEVGRTAIWKNEKHDCFFQKAIHRVRCRSDECIPEYLAWVMYQKAMNTNFDGLVTSATISHLTGVKLKGLQIQIPPLELQHHFADFVHQADKSKFELQQGMNQLEFLYKSLMQKSFNGEMFQCSLN